VGFSQYAGLTLKRRGRSTSDFDVVHSLLQMGYGLRARVAEDFVPLSGRSLQRRPWRSARRKCPVRSLSSVRRAVLKHPVIIDRLGIAECLAISIEMTLLRILMYALVSEPTQANKVRQKSRS
jgi:hypothetical protein